MNAHIIVMATSGHQALTTGLFLAVVALTIGITFWASRTTSGTDDYYAGGRGFSGFQNGLAIGGDYMSAASFLGISGAIALSGYDGFLYSIGFLVAWLVALLLVAEMLRNAGRHLDRRRVDLLPAGPDGRRRRAGGAAARRQQRHREEHHHLRGRRADDLLRHRRRHEGHDLGADREGRAADGGLRADRRPGAGEVRVQPVRPARHRGLEQRQGTGVPRAGAQVRRHRDQQDRLPVARHRARPRY